MTKRRILPVLLLVLAAILAVFASGVLDRSKVWSDMYPDRMAFRDGKLDFSLSSGDAYGVIASGPKLDLPKGDYRLKIRIFADGENALRIGTRNEAKLSPERVTLDPEAWDQIVDLHLAEDAIGLEFFVDFCAGTTLSFSDIRVYSPPYSDDAFTFAFLLLFAFLLYALWAKGWLDRRRGGSLALLALAVLYAVAPSLKDNLILVYDTGFHLARMMNLADGMRSGAFPVRAGGFTYNGWGAVTSVFYPDLPLYPSALLVLLGASPTYAAHAFEIGTALLSVLTMAAAARRILGERDMATAAAALYVLSVYRTTDVYTRGAWGEAAAMAVLPLFLLGLYEVCYGDKRRWPLLALGAWLILACHMLSVLIAAALAVSFVLLALPRILRERRLGALALAALLALTLCLYRLIPLADYSLQGLGAQALASPMSWTALAPAQLFLWGGGNLPVDPRDTTLSPLALEPGLPLMLGAALCLYALLCENRREMRRVLLPCLALGALFLCSMTTFFPWGHLAVLTRGLTDFIQFPWRFLMLPTLLFSLAGAYGYLRALPERTGLILALALAVLFCLPITTDQARRYEFLEFGSAVPSSISYLEYTLPGTDLDATKSREIRVQGDVSLGEMAREGTHLRLPVQAPQGGQIALPLFAYDGYVAQLDGQPLPVSVGEENRLSVELPAGAQGELSVRFCTKPLWRAADLISLLALAALCALLKGRSGRAAHPSV